MKHFDARFEVKEVTKAGNFCGYGSVYGVVDQGDDIVAAGAFADSLTEWKEKDRMPALLWQHKTDQPIGVYQSIKEDATGLLVEGRLALKVERGAEAYELLQMKAISGLSVGFTTREDSYDQKTNIHTITKADLWECSLVTFPMNDEARVSSVKAVGGVDTLQGMEAHLRDVVGLSYSEAKAIAARFYSIARRDAGINKDIANALKKLTDSFKSAK